MTNYQKLKGCIEINSDCIKCENNYCHTELRPERIKYLTITDESEIYSKTFIETKFEDILNDE